MSHPGDLEFPEPVGTSFALLDFPQKANDDDDDGDGDGQLTPEFSSLLRASGPQIF